MYQPTSPWSPAGLGDPAGTQAVVNAQAAQYSAAQDGIREQLMRRFVASDRAGLQDRRSRLREAFGQVPAKFAGELLERLRARRSDDELSRLFRDRIAEATRQEMRGILVAKAGASGGNGRTAPVAAGTSNAAMEVARRYYDAAIDAYQRQAYDEAITFFERQRHVRGLPATKQRAARGSALYNVAQSQKKAGRPAMGLLYLEVYQRAYAPTPKDRADARALLAELKKASGMPA